MAKYKLGIDIGGTFTDLILISNTGETTIHKTLSTPSDPSVGFVQGIRELAEMLKTPFNELIGSVDTIVHGTTVATNALLTLKGAKTALLTTRGFRDALEMRRGIREEQYNNRYRNVKPLIPRYLRFTINERIDSDGSILSVPDISELQEIAEKLRKEGVEAVAVCFMNAYRNEVHEKWAAQYLREYVPDMFIVASHEVMPSIRFYERVSTTAVSAFVGPIVANYFDNLKRKLREVDYKGSLLIMQSNGGVVSPEVVIKNPAVTVLSGPAAAPTAGAYYSRMLDYRNCITVDMGGTSFDAALVIDNQCVTGTEGNINRYRIALPALDIITIGAGGGSIGWLNDGGLLQMGPQSAGAMPGPVCYNRGGMEPTCTDADLVLGYLNPDFFAGGKLKLKRDKAVDAIDAHIARPLGLSVLEAAAGMYRIINSNMAGGVRQISIERGYDPREFLFIVAGGAGSIHAAEICRELEIPMFLVPNVSSIFCAAGMLLGDLKHDYIRSFYTSFSGMDREQFRALFNDMRREGLETLAAEGVLPEKTACYPVIDMRYQGQYHEVQLACDWEVVQEPDLDSIFDAFHGEHNRQFGYALKDEGTEMELINLRLRVVGFMEKPKLQALATGRIHPEDAVKEFREVYIPETGLMMRVPVYDGDLPLYGAELQGPCVIEKITTCILVSAGYDCKVDHLGSFLVYEKGKSELLSSLFSQTAAGYGN